MFNTIRFIGSIGLIWGLLTTVAAPRHDFHVSKGLVEYVAAEQSLQITLHLFIDDLEEALQRTGLSGLHLGSERESAQAARHVEDYLRRHFALTLNGQAINWRFVGKENDNDYQGMWCYLEVTDIPTPQQLRVRYDLLLEVYADQKNILNVSVPGQPRTTLLFERDNTVKTAHFD